MANYPSLMRADIERLLREYGGEMRYPDTPDIADSIEREMGGWGPTNNASPRSAAFSTPPTGDSEPVVVAPGGSADPFGLEPQRQSRIRRALALAAAILVFAVVGGGLALVFGGLPDRADEESSGSSSFEPRDFDLYLVPYSQSRGQWLPVDRETLEDRTDLEPFTWGLKPTSVSADGTTLAMLERPGDNTQMEPLPAQEVDIVIRDGLYGPERARFHPPVDVSTLQLSADGSRLVVERRNEPGTGMTDEWYVLDTSTGGLLATATETDIRNNNWTLIDADATMLFNVIFPVTGPDDGGFGPLEIVAYDLTTGTEQDRVSLDDIPAGIWWATEERAPDNPQVLWPGAALSPDSERIAVVHTDRPAVTILDTADLTVTESIDLEVDEGTLDRLSAWLGLAPQTTLAKTYSQKNRNATFSADGRYLYITGDNMSAGDDGKPVRENLGLIAIDLENGRVVAEGLAGESIGALTVAPDGSALYVSSYLEADTTPHALVRRLDPATLETLAERRFSEPPGLTVIAKPEAAKPEEASEGERNALDLLRVDLTDNGRGLEMLPVDAATHEPLPGYEPIDLGHHHTHAFSPDGQTMAVFVWPVSGGGSGEGGKLYLVDIVNWTVTDTGVEVDQNTGHLLFSEDGQALYWTLYTTTDPPHSMPRGYELYRFDLETGTQETVASFPESFSPGELHLFHDGARLAIWGVPVNPNNITEGPPQVMIVDLEGDEIVAQVEIPNLKAWQYQEIDGGSVRYRSYRPGLAWDLARELLYIAHPDADHVSVIDLAEGALKTQSDIMQPQSLLDQVFGWLAPSAAAKGGPTTTKTAVLSEDGNRLYIAAPYAEYETSEEPVGDTDLIVVDTETIEEIGRFELGTIVDTQAAPNGQDLLVRSYEQIATMRGHSLTKIDLLTGEMRGQLALPEPQTEEWFIVGFNQLSATGSQARLRILFETDESEYAEEVRIDLETLTIVGREKIGMHDYRTYYLRP